MIPNALSDDVSVLLNRSFLPDCDDNGIPDADEIAVEILRETIRHLEPATDDTGTEGGHR